MLTILHCPSLGPRNISAIIDSRVLYQTRCRWNARTLDPAAVSTVECAFMGRGKWSGPSDSCLGGSRKSEGMEATRRRAASSHSGRTAAGFGYQQSEHVAFWNRCTDTLPFHEMLTSLYMSFFRKINHYSVQLLALILCLCHEKTQPESPNSYNLSKKMNESCECPTIPCLHTTWIVSRSQQCECFFILRKH